MNPQVERVDRAADYIRSIIGNEAPAAGIVLGSGLSALGERIKNSTVIPYHDIPEYPESTAIGHKSNFIYGELGGKKVLAMQGRFHYYEGYPMDLVTIGIRTMARLGIKVVFLSNAAGSCNLDHKVGDMVIISDHINMMPNPLIGPNLDEFGIRFPDMSCPYDSELRRLAKDIAFDMGLSLKEGVYLASTGPTYETPAEVRFFKTIGADLLGMSTVPEVIVARHCGMRVFGMSVVTNVSNEILTLNNKNDGDDVVKQANNVAQTMSELFAKIIESL